MTDQYQAYIRAEIAKTEHAIARPGNDAALTAALADRLQNLHAILTENTTKTEEHAAKPAPDNEFYSDQPASGTACTLGSS